MSDLAVIEPLTPDAPVDFDEWCTYGHRLARHEAEFTFAVGDWLLYGAEHFPDRYMLAAATTGLAQQTLANATSVAKRVPPERRRADLSWSQHAEVAHLPAHDQTRLLNIAADERLNVRELRAVIQQEAEDRAVAHQPTDVGNQPGPTTNPSDGRGAADNASRDTNRTTTPERVPVVVITVNADQLAAARAVGEPLVGPLFDRFAMAGAPSAEIEVR